MRFRTAKVKMHVQPFKHDAVERTFDIVNQFLHIQDSTASKFGITVTSSDGSVSVSGRATSDVDMEVPIESMSLSGSYTMTASASGSAAGCALRLIDGSPSRSFGGSYMELKNNGDSTITATADSNAEYDALWLDIKAGTSVNFTLSVTMASDSFNEIALTNRGNVVSRPTVTVYGIGNVELAINAVTVLSFSIEGGSITIDAEEMNAYHGNALMNRRVTGDYSDLRLNVGENVISWRGDVTGIRVEDFSRWL